MNFLVDIITIAILALFVFIGYKRGLIKVIFTIFTFFIALIITFILYMPVSNYIIDNTEFDENIQTAIVDKFSFEKTDKEEDLELQDYITNYTADAANAGIESASRSIAVTAVQFITAIGLFVVSKLVLFLFRAFSDVLAELPVVKQFNEIGGVIYGLITGILFIYIALALIYFLAPTMNNLNIINMIHDSFITNILFEYNIILMLFFR